MVVPKILLTGASGFVGNALISQFNHDQLTLLGRTRPVHFSGDFFKADIDGLTDYGAALTGCQTVIHCAARVHIMDDQANDPLAAYRAVNSEGTIQLASQAARAGVKRFIFLSSVKVLGEETPAGRPFRFNDALMPQDPYGMSKAEAEIGLQKLAYETGMDVVIIRPPLIYGPGVKANFAAMLKLVSKNLPLPLGAINNLRSFVALDNLVDLIKTCVLHPNAANQVFLVSDDQDISTSELLRMMSRAAGKKSRLLAVPVSMLRIFARLTGKKAVIDRLCGNLQVDISHTKTSLGWQPPLTLEAGIARCLEFPAASIPANKV